jgi:hypothetical protein
MHCITTVMQYCYITRKIREKKGKKGIALRDIASKVHLLARLAMQWQVGYMK